MQSHHLNLLYMEKKKLLSLNLCIIIYFYVVSEKSSRLRTLYSSKKYSNLRGSTDSIDRLSALNNVSKKKPEYIQKHVDLTTNTISSALCSTNSNVVQKSIEVLRDLSSNFYVYLFIYLLLERIERFILDFLLCIYYQPLFPSSTNIR